MNEDIVMGCSWAARWFGHDLGMLVLILVEERLDWRLSVCFLILSLVLTFVTETTDGAS